MRRLFVEDLARDVLFTGMLGVFAVVALLLAAAGVYGLISFSVSQRAREIGVRMALGAQPRSILGMVIVRRSVPLTLGLFLGSAGAAALVSVTASALQQVDVRDPLAYLAVARAAGHRDVRRHLHSRPARDARGPARRAARGVRSFRLAGRRSFRGCLVAVTLTIFCPRVQDAPVRGKGCSHLPQVRHRVLPDEPQPVFADNGHNPLREVS